MVEAAVVAGVVVMPKRAQEVPQDKVEVVQVVRVLLHLLLLLE
jgi:hypothetical protein